MRILPELPSRPAKGKRMPSGKSSRRKKKSAARLSMARRTVRFVKSPWGKVALALMLIAGIMGGVVFSHYYWKYAKLIDAKLAHGPFNRTSKILAAPQVIYVGEEIPPEEVISLLRNAGYSESRHNRIGHFLLKENSIEIYPGPMSYFRQEPAVLYFHDERVTRIVSLSDNNPQTAYELEPELITNLFDEERSKRRLLAYEDIPTVVINAVLAIEDHRFFSHAGFDVIRTARAAFDGYIVEGRRPRGTSTLTQQLARGFFLTPEQTYRRKLAELLIAIQLESRLSKEQILEYYMNQIPLGRRGTFNVMGMGEAAKAYFDKDIRELTVAEAALLAGLIQRPSYLNPYRHPERARNRRNTVLDAMLRHEYITQEGYQQAINEPIELAVGKIESRAAPYFVDLVNKQLQEWFTTDELITQSYWVYTTLDMNLQRAAVEAVRIGMAEVDERLARQRRFRGKTPPKPQVALVALDTETGEVRAVMGGRNYGLTQLNRALAKRQPGSAFKPFVYAAAISTAVEDEFVYEDEEGLEAEDPPEPEPEEEGTEVLHEGFAPKRVLTPVTMVDDVPTTFWWDDEAYEPSNFANKIYGEVTLRKALYKSLNIATVKVAQMAGFEKVSEIARRVGLGSEIKPTPAIALGAYEATPLDIAGAYTAFANDGVMKKPYFVRRVRDPSGRELIRNQPQEKQVLDPRVAYIITHMLQDVIRRGTAVRVRGMGFNEPAAGKTGTDDDGWFAGFTSNLLCIVWVGFDDNTDLKIEGSKSALPIWTEFMKRAHELREYRNPEPFESVDGIVTVAVDPDTHQLATHSCPDRQTEVFIAGSQPTQYCRIHGGGRRTLLATNVAGWESDSSGSSSKSQEPEEAEGIRVVRGNSPSDAGRRVGDPAAAESRAQQDGSPKPKQKRKKGLFGRILDVFR